MREREEPAAYITGAGRPGTVLLAFSAEDHHNVEHGMCAHAQTKVLRPVMVSDLRQGKPSLLTLNLKDLKEKNKMKRIMIIASICLTLLGVQSSLAQTVPPGDPDPRLSHIEGLMIRKFAKSGSEKFTDYVKKFQSVRVNYYKGAEEWIIFTKATFPKNGKHKLMEVDLWIKYYERSGLLAISLDRENRNQWYLKTSPHFKITIPEGRSTFRLDFTGSINGTNQVGRNYNWMKGSWLLATPCVECRLP